jgi:hypothetical protein
MAVAPLKQNTFCSRNFVSNIICLLLSSLESLSWRSQARKDGPCIWIVIPPSSIPTVNLATAQTPLNKCCHLPGQVEFPWWRSQNVRKHYQEFRVFILRKSPDYMGSQNSPLTPIKPWPSRKNWDEWILKHMSTNTEFFNIMQQRRLKSNISLKAVIQSFYFSLEVVGYIAFSNVSDV